MGNMARAETIDDFLAQRTLALAGASRNGEGFGNLLRRELTAKGYTVRLIHPEATEIAGEPCARSVADVAGQVGGLILVTPPAATTQLVREADACGVRRLWIQQGAESEEALRYCEERGLAFVAKECLLMFAAPQGIHRAHRWLNKVFGKLPRESSSQDDS